MAKKNLERSPLGRAIYPHLTTPDTKFQPKGEYHVKLNVPADEAAALVEKIDQAMKASQEKAAKDNPKEKKIKLCDNAPYSQEEDGTFSFSFKMKALVEPKGKEAFAQKPALFDKFGKPLPENTRIGGGSQMKVAFEIVPFWTKLLGAGVTLRLKAVMIHELIEWGGGNASYFGFEVAEEEESEGAETPAPGVPAGEGAAGGEEETPDF